MYFAVAVALAAGGAGVRQFTDEWVQRPDVVALRDRVFAAVDPTIGEAQARAVVTLRDGRRLERFIADAVGSLEQPMSDRALDAKVRDLCTAALTIAQTDRLIDACRNVEQLPDVRVIAEAARA